MVQTFPGGLRTELNIQLLQHECLGYMIYSTVCLKTFQADLNYMSLKQWEQLTVEEILN